MNNTLAHTWAGGGPPGPWILLFPLLWAAVVIGAILVLRRTVWRGRGPWQARAAGGESPVAARTRFAAGEMDENEYWRGWPC